MHCNDDSQSMSAHSWPIDPSYTNTKPIPSSFVDAVKALGGRDLHSIH